MKFKKLSWLIKRHPYLYRTRFRLLSRNVKSLDTETGTYNLINPKSQIPSYFHDINKKIFPLERPDSDFETLIILGTWLLNNIKCGRGLSLSSSKALRLMLDGDGGVCSDISQIFNNFCVLNDLNVREWGSTRIPFDEKFGGHSFNEVFCKDLRKWVLVDIYYSMYFVDESNTPLSVLEYFKNWRKNKKIKPVIFNNSMKKNLEAIARNYTHPSTVPFLICNYNNAVYDKSLNQYSKHLPVFIIHFGLYLIGKSYHYKFPLDDYNKII